VRQRLSIQQHFSRGNARDAPTGALDTYPNYQHQFTGPDQ
jgi:hypothetical protein